MSKRRLIPPLLMVPRVTQRHGRIFARFVLSTITKSEIPFEAFGMTDVIGSPPGDDYDTPAHWRYDRIMDEIMRRILAEIDGPLIDAFVTIAGEVIERERKRQGDV